MFDSVTSAFCAASLKISFTIFDATSIVTLWGAPVSIYARASI